MSKRSAPAGTPEDLDADPEFSETAPGWFVAHHWIPAPVVQQQAVELGLSVRMLRRLSSAGLLATCRERGLGYGRGSRWYYPERSLAELEAVASARVHRISSGLLRHRVWWRPGGQLENWLRWRDDRVGDLRPSAPAWDLEPALGDDLPDDRDAAIVELAASMGGRHPPLPGGVKTLRDQNDREALARIYISLVLKDDLLADLADTEDAAAARAALQAMLGQPVDGEPGDERGPTLGELLERGFGKPVTRTLPGVPGELFAAMFAYLPDPQSAAAEMAALSEERAATLRDGLIAWAERAGKDYAAQLEASPPLAGLMSLWWDRLSTLVPAVLLGSDP